MLQICLKKLIEHEITSAPSHARVTATLHNACHARVGEDTSEEVICTPEVDQQALKNWHEWMEKCMDKWHKWNDECMYK